MILIDTNALVVLIVGLIDTRLFKHHNRTSIYDEEDFNDLLHEIGAIEKLVVLPNVWTETDNLLNKFSGDYKTRYVGEIRKIITSTTEKFIASIKATESYTFYDLGLTDSLLLYYAKECQYLITSDSKLADYALANGISVYDMVKNKNQKLKNQ